MPTLGAIARAWGRIGVIGFGGPPAHIALLRDLVVERRRWLRPEQFEDGLAAANLLPGPASTQLAIYTAWRTGGPAGALVGGLAFIVPGLILIVALAALFLGSPPDWIRGAGAGAGAAVAAVAVDAGLLLLRPAWTRVERAPRWRFVAYVLLGAASAATLGAWLVAVLAICGLVELGWRRVRVGGLSVAPFPVLAVVVAASTGTLAALAWVAFKVGALSYGGGFVIIPLMQADAVERYGWMTDPEFLNAVALGQVTPGPVTHTVAVVGYAAAGVPGAVLAALVAFAPSFAFVLVGARRFDRLVANRDVRAFFDGAGPAAIGAILGSAVPLALALQETWQWAVLAGAAVALLVLRRGVVLTLLAAGAVGAVAVVLGAPLGV
ncbi:MAG TPA: chromate efflux transporter [Gaiellaceae bacterium]|nr:chromate efflux transporter [Gaiellaceae bacterium]